MTVFLDPRSSPLPAAQSDYPALIYGDVALSHREFTARVADHAASLGPDRRLHIIGMRNDIESIVQLFGAIVAQHPVIMLDGDDRRHDEIRRQYEGATDLHPDLAVLLSTSGSTGSPKLVRLSYENLRSNAQSIAEYLNLSSDDRAITSLPPYYCYGLSVLTSHLLVGASIVLTDLSVADACFWDLARDHQVTSFAGVPHTFDLLDTVAFDAATLPSLRYVTQAGGRMRPEAIRRWAEHGEQADFDLFVMYGQTEATARMAYLPPHLAATRPETIGIPIPGGEFALRALDEAIPGEPEIGELVYTGDNVMMGYAHGPADLARGHDLTELHTGDLARQTDDGLWEIAGRLDRAVKVFGLRVDLPRLESRLDVPATIVATEDGLDVFVATEVDPRAVRDRIVDISALPAPTIRVHHLDELPVTPRGKVDYAALQRHAELTRSLPSPPRTDRVDAATIRDVYAACLDRVDATTADSFVDLGGDSLSFVEASIHIGRLLGQLPQGWQYLSADELAAVPKRTGKHRRLVLIEPAIMLRAVAIVLIVLSHADLFVVMGSAHALLAVGGFNLGRFSLAVPERWSRVRRIVAATAAVAVPAALWIAVVGAATGDYSPATAVFLNGALGSNVWDLNWQFWFFEVIVWTNLLLAALLAIPAISTTYRRKPFATAIALVIAGLAIRYVTVGVTADDVQEYTIGAAMWCVAIGLAAAQARTRAQRVLVAVLAVTGAWNFFGDDLQRQAVLTTGLLILLMPCAIPVPAVVATMVRYLAGASMWIYLTHWQVYPAIEAAGHPALAVLASLIVGILAHAIYRIIQIARVSRLASSHLNHRGE